MKIYKKLILGLTLSLSLSNLSFAQIVNGFNDDFYSLQDEPSIAEVEQVKLKQETVQTEVDTKLQGDLFEAIRNKNLNKVKELLKQGAKPDLVNPYTQTTPLYEALKSVYPYQSAWIGWKLRALGAAGNAALAGIGGFIAYWSIVFAFDESKIKIHISDDMRKNINEVVNNQKIDDERLTKVFANKLDASIKLLDKKSEKLEISLLGCGIFSGLFGLKSAISTISLTKSSYRFGKDFSASYEIVKVLANASNKIDEQSLEFCKKNLKKYLSMIEK